MSADSIWGFGMVGVIRIWKACRMVGMSRVDGSMFWCMAMLTQLYNNNIVNNH